ncbi:hypothetical protein BPAE_1222g00010 [Botrytis paeoniae]|uniref:HTH CENPB-type domain-containing protein n=1 Tax=Botrytis paeoniae TaxID=278948 RepID=A0A4Z1EBD3_9HELO|nr:hypothetical protein BPAE_1222g00010 [Botrytis paeoniae]
MSSSSEQQRLEIHEANKRKYPGRPRARHPLPSEPEKGQTTLFDNIIAARKRRGVVPDIRNIQVPPLIDGSRRHWIGGFNEEAIIKAFQHFPNQEGDHLLETRSSYPRELKLRAIQYHRYTWKKDKNDNISPISIYYAARNLGVTPSLLSKWITTEKLILSARKGSRRSYNTRRCTHPEMEERLYEKFCFFRTVGKRITHRWFTRHAKEIYRKLYPSKVLRSEESPSRWIYLDFKFSNCWFTAFLRRHRISLRCRTKRAQKAPGELREVIQKWCQFTRRNTIRHSDSIAGSSKNESIQNPRIGRFLLSNIANMDQTPLAFEFGSSERTYDHAGNNTVFLKGSKGGWEKRQATLQIMVSADGISRCKPLIMFQGKEGVGSSTRKAEFKKYHSGVDVIFNPKGYCNTKELLKWFKHQYKHSTAESPSENEPRLLTLDSFAAHKSQGRKKLEKESISQCAVREQSELEVLQLR